jgi:hypothetical protein
MKRRRNGNPLAMSLQFIADCEMRVAQQKRLIARLKRKGQPTARAWTVLKRYEGSLIQLQNHAALTQDLMKPDRS